MPLSYIINSICEKYGYDAIENRALVVEIINRATKEVYEWDDLPGSLREMCVKVAPNNVIALPYYIGELRAMRGRTFKDKIEFKEMAPKYSYNSWPDVWKNWRVMRKSPLQNSIVNAAAAISLSIAQPESSAVEVTLTGQTVSSNRWSETLTIEPGETSVQTSTPYIDMFSITKGAVNTQNITVTGKDLFNADLILAVIPNDRLESLYTIVDVAQYPSGGEDGLDTRYIEVLYKEPLMQLTNDGDCFPCEGFDDAIVYKALEHIYSELADGGEKAVGFYKKCEQFIFNRVIHSNGATQKEIIFAPQAYFTLFPKCVPYYRGYRGRTFI